jgi:hypothetical protein
MTKKLRLLPLLICAIVLVSDLDHAEAVDGVDCRIAKSAIGSASRLRSLAIKRSVPCKLQNRSEVEQYLRSAINEKVPAERIEKEGTVNRMLGLIPRDYHYLEGLIGLYTDQLGGYYDPEKEYYAMAAWMPGVMQMPIAVHELTHALQDQHFALEKLIDPKTQVSDEQMARAALIEGDATAVMLDYSRELSGEGPLAEEDSVSLFMIQNITGAMLSASLHQAPPALQTSLIFPYVSGLNFAHALLKRGGYQEIDKAFARLPTSTEEILHPDIYLAGKKDYQEFDPPKPPPGVALVSEKPVFSDRLGEFTISTLLGSFLPPQRASIAASGWGGDSLALYELKDAEHALLVWELRWDSVNDAEEFFDALTAAYVVRYESDPERRDDGVRFIDRDFGSVLIKRDEQKVLLTIGGQN